MKDQKYNGWTNYATWRVSLEMFDEKPEEWEEVTAEECKDYAEEVVSDGADGFALDYALAFIQEVNWQEIADHLNERLKDQKYLSKVMKISDEMAEFKVVEKLGQCAWLQCENGDEMFTEEAQDLFNCEYDRIYNLLVENA